MEILRLARRDAAEIPTYLPPSKRRRADPQTTNSSGAQILALGIGGSVEDGTGNN